MARRQDSRPLAATRVPPPPRRPLTKEQAISVLAPSQSAKRYATESWEEEVGLITKLRIHSTNETAHWALLSDPHFPADPEEGRPPHKPTENFPIAVDQAIDAAPQAAMVLGDIAYRHGLPEDYSAVKPMLARMAENFPVCLTLGNHDVRENFLTAFSDHPIPDETPAKAIVIVEHGPVRFLILDSSYRVDVVPGMLGFRQRAWLDKFLAESDQTPTIVCFHHALDDNDKSLVDVDRLLGVILPHKQVKAIIHGHWHDLRRYEIDGVHVLQLPSAGLPLVPDVPIGWLNATFTGSGAEFEMRSIEPHREKILDSFSLEWR